jgi:dipeptidyl aminopeptidase/acylaminoacyl peptidase
MLKEKLIRLFAFVTLGAFVLAGSTMASGKRPATVEDCVCVRRIVSDEVKISPDRKHVGYLLKAPNLRTNQNDYELWVRDLHNWAGVDNGKLVFSSAKELSGLRWLSDGKKIALLENRRKPKSRILLIDTVTNEVEAIADATSGIMDYSIDAAGETAAYTTFLDYPRATQPNLNPETAARGFHIPFKKYPNMLAQEKNGYTEREDVWVLRREPEGRWERTTITSPTEKLSGERPSTGFNQPLGLNLSPDGNYLAFLYEPDDIPQGWSQGCVFLKYRESGENPSELALYNTKTHDFSGPITFPYAFIPIYWSDDSRALVLPAAGPVGSEWEKQDCKTNRDLTNFHVFALDVATFAVSEVLMTTTPVQGLDVVSWKNSGDEMVVGLRQENSFARLYRSGQEWHETDRITPSFGGDLSSVTTNDGNVLVGIRQTHTVPPELFMYDVRSRKDVLLTDLNPEIRTLTLGEFEKEEWTNAYGGKISGNLIKPVGFEPGNKYPLVIMLTWADNRFVCDGYYETAFPPQPLANSGFFVLIFNIYDVASEGSKQPEGPPANREAETMIASVESAVNHLAERGLVDPQNVGIIGFSRSSWKVDYMLTHSTFEFRAASSADSGVYNYGSYWLFDGLGAESEESGYGGPPYGATLQNWIKGAPAFNADKVQVPLLIEFTGQGDYAEPLGAYEFYTALNRLDKPVDLFFYPNGDHPLDTPFERVASLQRNVDWFRFWMQGYQGKSPHYDPDQFVRWRKLREQQESNDRMRARGKDPNVELLRDVPPEVPD